MPVVLIGGDKDLEDSSIGVYQEVTLSAFDLLVSVITDVFLARAPLFPWS